VEMQDDDETQRREDTVGEKKTREFWLNHGELLWAEQFWALLLNGLSSVRIGQIGQDRLPHFIVTRTEQQQQQQELQHGDAPSCCLIHLVTVHSVWYTTSRSSVLAAD
jgi:hypothetical protein